MNAQTNTLYAGASVLAPAFYLLQDQGYSLSYDAVQEWWIAKKGDLQFLAYSTIELCGLIYLYEGKGNNWRVTDEKIEAYLKLEAPNDLNTLELE